MGNGNTELIDYGIQNEESDIRLHVCVVAKQIWFFATRIGVEAVNSGKYRLVPVYTMGILTAEGYIVPPRDLNAEVRWIPQFWLDEIQFKKSESPSIKGRKATEIAKRLILEGMCPLDLAPKEATEKDMQIKGIDLIVTVNAKIQVKCDYDGGFKENGGTGNLFLQVKECNPFNQH